MTAVALESILTRSWGIYCDSDLKLIIFSPPKCASTAVFSAIHAAKNPASPFPYRADISHEHLPELCIHQHVRSHLVPELAELKRCFASTEYEKILIVRDPLSRLVSSVLSKYLIPKGFFAYELQLEGSPYLNLPFSYSDSQDLYETINQIARRLLIRDSLQGVEPSHATPISDLINPDLLVAFDQVVNVSGPEGLSPLEVLLKDRFHAINLPFDGIARINESPISASIGWLSKDIYQRGLKKYKADYELFDLAKPKHPGSHPELNQEQLSSLNLFLGCAYRVNVLYRHIQKLEDSLIHSTEDIQSPYPDPEPVPIKGQDVADTILEPFDWQHFEALKQKLAAGSPQAVLEPLKALRSRYAEPAIATVLGDALSRLGRTHEAIACLQADVTAGDDNLWTHYCLGHLLAGQGQLEAAATAFSACHRLCGWTASEANGYVFTHDYFAGHIPTWQCWFDTTIQQRPIRILEVGSWQGGSALWLLDQVIAERGGSITCVDTWEGSSEHAFLGPLGLNLEELFDANISRSGHGQHVQKHQGCSQDVLPQLAGQFFDFIYIDGAHEADLVLQDALNAHPLLAPGGFLVFSDLAYSCADAQQNPTHGINTFLELAGDAYEEIERGTQLLLRRRP
jgi:predicted O-methyltransferase YrrM